MTSMVITRGLPASGKTTFARAWVAEDPATRARVNKDDLRRQLHDGVYLGHETENVINMIRDNAIRSLLRKGISVVNDDTNLPQQVARDLARIARNVDPEITITVKDMTDVSAEVCIERDKNREHSVGEKVIRGMAAKLAGKSYPLPLPEDPESGPAFEPYLPDENLPGAWIVDLDGTLALNLSGRSPYDWHRVGEDFLNVPVYLVARGLDSQGIKIVLASGRDEVCRPETEEWIRTHAFWLSWSPLYMRPQGDSRKDSIVKREILDEIAKDYRVVGVCDDRPQVCRMWREIGLPVFQVGDPHVEF
jgi:predicted kinase